MRRFVYAPDVQAFIETQDHGVLDVSTDIISGSVTRNLDKVSNAALVLQNRNRKYLYKKKGPEVPLGPVFRPMDRIAIYLTRVHQPMLVFSGYLDDCTYEQIYPAPITINASCTLKRLLYTYLDPGLEFVRRVLSNYGFIYDPGSGTFIDQKESLFDMDASGGLAGLMRFLLHTPGGWPIGTGTETIDTVHILKLPATYLAKASRLLTDSIGQFEQDYNNMKEMMKALMNPEGYNPIFDFGNGPVGGGTIPGTGGPAGKDGNPLPPNLAKSYKMKYIYGPAGSPITTPPPTGNTLCDIASAIASAWAGAGLPPMLGIATAYLESGIDPDACNTSFASGIFQDLADGNGRVPYLGDQVLGTWVMSQVQSGHLKGTILPGLSDRYPVATQIAQSISSNWWGNKNAYMPAGADQFVDPSSNAQYNLWAQWMEQAQAPGGAYWTAFGGITSYCMSGIVKAREIMKSCGITLGGVGSIGGTPTAKEAAQAWAKVVLSYTKLSAGDSKKMTIYHDSDLQDIVNAANGKPCNDGVWIDWRVWALMAYMCENYGPSSSYAIHSSHGPDGLGGHQQGFAYDLNSINGVDIGGPDPKAGPLVLATAAALGSSRPYGLPGLITSGYNSVCHSDAEALCIPNFTFWGVTCKSHSNHFHLCYTPGIPGAPTEATPILPGGSSTPPPPTKLLFPGEVGTGNVGDILVGDPALMGGGILPYTFQIHPNPYEHNEYIFHVAGLNTGTGDYKLGPDEIAIYVSGAPDNSNRAAIIGNTPAGQDAQTGSPPYPKGQKGGTVQLVSSAGGKPFPPADPPGTPAPTPATGGGTSAMGVEMIQQNPNDAVMMGPAGMQVNAAIVSRIAFSSAMGFAMTFPTANIQDNLYTGYRALMGDVPLMDWISKICTSAGRRFQSMPNGDFLAFYPDYFGWSEEPMYKNPYLLLRDIEITDLNVVLSDKDLSTHVFLTTDIYQTGEISLADRMVSTVASVEDKASFEDVIVDGGSYDPYTFLMRYGARPYFEEVVDIKHPLVQFLYAWQTFLNKWAQQFICTASFTFMPELWPGGRVKFDGHDLIMFVESVTHNFNRESGFTTDATLTSPSSEGKGSFTHGMVLFGGPAITEPDHTPHTPLTPQPQ